MVSEERLIYLLGPDRPARVIPAGLARKLPEVADEDHTPLHQLDREPANKHSSAVPGYDNLILAYPHDPEHDSHQVLVSASSKELLEHHLKTSSICVRAAKPGEDAEDDGLEPLYLFNLFAKAVEAVTGASLGELWEAAGDDPPSNLAGLLGDAAGEVRTAAESDLERGLQKLVSVGTIGIEDLDALEPNSLIDALLMEQRDVFDPDPDAIVTTILHPPGVQQVHYSINIEG